MKIPKTKAGKLILYLAVFGIGIFSAEYLLDLIFNLERDALKIEFLQSLISGLIAGILYFFLTERWKKTRK